MLQKYNLKVVLLAGGVGTRLWPLSRAAFPKQFLNLFGDRSLLQSTLDRIENLDPAAVVTVCNDEHRFLVAEQLRGTNKPTSIILETDSKNTAASVTLAALNAEKEDLLLVLPSDHIILEPEFFHSAVNSAAALALDDHLVTFGIVPSSPNTGFGYIKKGNPIGSAHYIDAFFEKPTLKDAKAFIQSKHYLWNSGMFLFKASLFLEEIKTYRPLIYNSCKLSMDYAVNDLDFLRVSKPHFSDCPEESVDYAVMENTSKGCVVPLCGGWSDVGSWSSLWNISKKDVNQNTFTGDVIARHTKNSYAMIDDRLAVLIGLEDIIVVSTKDALMIAKKDEVDEVKEIVLELKAKNRSECELHREVHRPWGKYESIDSGDGYQVKRITVKPGAKLSVQKHRYRSEHWIVVSGVANVLNGDNEYSLKENESTYIPLGAVHSLENPGDSYLELIEVQSGSYLGEDDIIRFSDKYGRVSE